MKLPGETTLRSCCRGRLCSHTITSRSGSWYGSGRNRTLRITTKKQAPAAPAEDPVVTQGKQLWLTKACIGCHSLDATKPIGIGPNLAGIGSRKFIAAGTFLNTDENLAHWIRRPQELKQGVLMVVPEMSEAEAKVLAAYLRMHK